MAKNPKKNYSQNLSHPLSGVMGWAFLTFFRVFLGPLRRIPPLWCVFPQKTSPRTIVPGKIKRLECLGSSLSQLRRFAGPRGAAVGAPLAPWKGGLPGSVPSLDVGVEGLAVGANFLRAPVEPWGIRA